MNYYFLASKCLQPYLAKIQGVGWYQGKANIEEMIDILEEDYNALTKGETELLQYYKVKAELENIKLDNAIKKEELKEKVKK